MANMMSKIPHYQNKNKQTEKIVFTAKANTEGTGFSKAISIIIK